MSGAVRGRPEDDSSAELPEATRRWVAGAVGGTVTAVERCTRGRQAWWVDLRDDGGAERRWMVKGRRAPAAVVARSRILSDFGPAREAAAMGALAGTEVLVPVVGGFDPDTSSLLVERVPGSALLQRAPVGERELVIRHYAGQLALLHRLDPGRLAVGPAIPAPRTAEEMVLGGWLASAEADAATAAARRRHAEPLHDLAVRWLHRHRPEGRGLEVARLLHGDAGVNNFLYSDGRVTALLDWELSVFGDPMSDLGNARYREALYPTGTYGALVAGYQAAGGWPVDRAAVAYYTVLAATMLSLGMVANVHRPRAGQPEVVARFWQDAVARVVACEAMAEGAGVAVAYDDAPSGGPSPFDPLAELLVDRLDRAAASAGEGQLAAEAAGYGQLARTVQRVAHSGAAVDERLVDEAGAVLGRRPASVAAALDGLAALAVRVSDGELGPLLTVLARDARRRLEVLRPLQAAEAWEDAAPAVAVAAGSPTAPVLPPFE